MNPVTALATRTTVQSHFLYLSGRGVAVTSKPLVLFLAVNHLSSAAAQAIALGFVLASLGLVATAADPHRLFYPHRFGRGPIPRYQWLDVYAGATGMLTGIGGLGVLVAAIALSASWWTAVASMIYFASEKLQDEILRYRLFDKRFDAWGGALIGRALVQFSLIGALFAMQGSDASGAAAVFSLAAGNFIVFTPQLPWRAIRRGLALRTTGMVRILRRSARALVSLRLYWLAAGLGAGIGYLDRIIALFADAEVLPIFLLVIMCFGAVAMSVDFFYLSRRRRDFLQGRITIAGVVTDPAFGGSIALGVLAGGGASLAALHFANTNVTLPWVYVLLIAALQTAFAVTMIPREISYWAHPIRRLLGVEATFWVLFGALAGIAVVRDASLATTLVLGAGAALVRLTMHVVLARGASVVDTRPDWPPHAAVAEESS